MGDKRPVRRQCFLDLGAEPQVVGGDVFLGFEFGDDRIELAQAGQHKRRVPNRQITDSIRDIPVIHRLGGADSALSDSGGRAYSSGDRDGSPGLNHGRQRPEDEEGTEGPISADRRWTREPKQNCPSAR